MKTEKKLNSIQRNKLILKIGITYLKIQMKLEKALIKDPF